MSTEAAPAVTEPDEAPAPVRPWTIKAAVAAIGVNIAGSLFVPTLYDSNHQKLLDIAHKMATRAAAKGHTYTEDQILSTIPQTSSALTVAAVLGLVLAALGWFVYNGKSWAKWLVVVLVLLENPIRMFLLETPPAIKAGLWVIGASAIATIIFTFIKPSAAYFRAVSPPFRFFNTQVDSPKRSAKVDSSEAEDDVEAEVEEA